MFEIDESNNSTIFDYLDKFKRALQQVETNQIATVAKLLKEIGNDSTVYVIGNGGSATTASHMATDFGVGSFRRGKVLRAVSLVDNTGVITATANDIDFSDVFSEQLKLLLNPQDLLILISASGNSENLLKANEIAQIKGVTTISLTGFDGGNLKTKTDFNIHIETGIGEYGIVEDLHLMVSHIITECIRS